MKAQSYLNFDGRCEEAINFYKTYAPEVGDPLRTFVATINEAGEALSAEGKEDVMEELPKCFPKISLLLGSLAHED